MKDVALIKGQIVGLVAGVGFGITNVHKQWLVSVWWVVLAQIVIQLSVAVSVFAFLEWRAFRKDHPRL